MAAKPIRISGHALFEMRRRGIGAADVRRMIRNPGQESLAWIYIPYAQNPSWNLTLAVRTASPPAGVVPTLRKAVAELDPQLPVLSVHTMPQHIHDSMADDRVQVVLWSLFATVAISLAAIGIYGVLSFSVARRTRDIAIQMALGAQRQNVLRQVIARGLRLTLVGLGLGLALSWGGWRVVSSQLYVGAAPGPLVEAAVAILLALVAVIACWLPARRAAMVDPMTALRYE